MSNTTYKMNGSRSKNIEELSEILKNAINAELQSESWRGTEELKIVLLTFEKYYFRNSSYASLTVMLTQMGDFQTADIIGFGGGNGVFNISWGANAEFADNARIVLQNNGFSDL